MKQVYLPNLDTVENVLNLLTSPEAMVKFMNDLKTIQAEVKADLGAIKSKAEADRLLAEAYELNAEVDKRRNEVFAEIEALKLAAEGEYKKASDLVVHNETRLASWERELRGVQSELEQKLFALNKERADFEEDKKRAEEQIGEMLKGVTQESEAVEAKRLKVEAALSAVKTLE